MNNLSPEQRIEILESRLEAYKELMEDIERAVILKDYDTALELCRKRGKRNP